MTTPTPTDEQVAKDFEYLLRGSCLLPSERVALHSIQQYVAKLKEQCLALAAEVERKNQLIVTLATELRLMFSNSRVIKTIGGQTIGAESHRVEYTGWFHGRIEDLLNALSTPNPGKEMLEEWKNSLKACRKALEAQMKWHEEYDEYGGWPDSDLCVLTYTALKSIPAIDAAREGKEQG
jgi:hypothetical protein